MCLEYTRDIMNTAVNIFMPLDLNTLCWKPESRSMAFSDFMNTKCTNKILNVTCLSATETNKRKRSNRSSEKSNCFSVDRRRRSIWQFTLQQLLKSAHPHYFRFQGFTFNMGAWSSAQAFSLDSFSLLPDCICVNASDSWNRTLIANYVIYILYDIYCKRSLEQSYHDHSRHAPFNIRRHRLT